MFVETSRIIQSEAYVIGEEMRLAPEEIEAMAIAVGQSDPALVLTLDSRPFVVCGFIPKAILTDTAYAWMQWTSEIYDHPVAATRKCVEIFTEVRKRYPRIYGHCSFGPKPTKLLQRMGARFWTDTDGRSAYVIGE